MGPKINEIELAPERYSPTGPLKRELKTWFSVLSSRFGGLLVLYFPVFNRRPEQSPRSVGVKRG
jgi:hypothetical protein